MIITNYKQYLCGTLKMSSAKIRSHILSLFFEGNIAYECPKQVDIQDDGNQVDVSDLELTEQVLKCLRANDQAIKLYEKWELDKDYKYSTILVTKKFDELYKLVVAIPVTEHCNESDFSVDFMSDDMKPIHFDLGYMHVLKFYFVFSALHPQTREELLLKYPVIVAFYPDTELIEVRFDAIKPFFIHQSQNIYVEVIRKIVNYIKSKYSIDVQGLDMTFMRDITEPGVKLVAEHMKMASGGRAVLEVGDNEECVLPFIDELRAIISEYVAYFEKVPELKDILEQFIFEKSEMSEYPWIELKWGNEIKTREIRAKFTFDYDGSGYGIIQHYYSQVLFGKERMERVTKCIGKHKGSAGQQ